MLQIRFFHKVGSMNAPVTDGEKLVWSVLEAERQTIRFYNAIVNIFLGRSYSQFFRLIHDLMHVITSILTLFYSL
jgi:hypothetical protein